MDIFPLAHSDPDGAAIVCNSCSKKNAQNENRHHFQAKKPSDTPKFSSGKSQYGSIVSTIPSTSQEELLPYRFFRLIGACSEAYVTTSRTPSFFVCMPSYCFALKYMFVFCL